MIMPRRIRLSMPVIEPILDGAEKSLVDRGLAWLRERQPRDSGVLWAQLRRVAMLGVALDEAPSLLLPASLGRSSSDETSLVAELSHLDPLGGELRLPEKALIARAFLLAKIALLRAFATALDPAAPGAEPALAREFRGELAQSVYTAIAAEILIGLCSDAGVGEETKRRAARQLILIWDGAVKVEIDDFCPLLESVWQARARMPARLGCLAGAGEYLRLVQENCPSQFLEFFTRDNVAEEEIQAFEEFLFALPHEDVIKLRAAMKRESRTAVDAEFASRELGIPVAAMSAVDDPEEFYRSYHRRRIAAEFRRLTRAPGPRRVAEAYIMMFVLDSSGESSRKPA